MPTLDQLQAQLNPTATPLTIAGTSSGTDSGLSLDGGSYVDFPSSSPSGGAGSAGGGAPAIDYNAIAQYDQSIGNINSAIGRLPDQYNSGAGAIDSSYQNALNQLLLSKNQANQSYDSNVSQNKQDYVGSKNTIRSRAGSSLNGLLRLLGSRGAGGGSAATISAPGAVARQATLQQNDVGQTFGKNSQNLDLNWNNYLLGYNNQVSGATNQRDTQKSDLQRQIDQNKASLLQTLAQLSGQRALAAGGSPAGAAQPYLDQANSILDSSSHYSTSPISYQTQAYNAPDLAKYTFNSVSPTVQGQQQTNDYTSPYLAALLGKRQLAGA